VKATTACGVDYVKVGIAPGELGLETLAALPSAAVVVPVLIADHGISDALFEQALARRAPVLMLDTADKARGSLFDCLAPAELAVRVRMARRAGQTIGLAGALRLHHVPHLIECAPDIAGFRGALCNGGRAGRLDGERVREMQLRLRATKADAHRSELATLQGDAS
jgi:(5-formylfuran-3-yl)methyl phosphate synthase